MIVQKEFLNKISTLGLNSYEGKIWAESEPGSGTTFFIELPVRSIEKLEKKEIPKKDTSKSPKRILVLDDEVEINELLKEVLEKEGCTVKTASNANEALKLIEKEDFELVLSDIKIPDIDGKVFYEKAKELKPELNFVFMTGDTASPDTQSFLHSKNLPFLKKPFGIEDLKTILL